MFLCNDVDLLCHFGQGHLRRLASDEKSLSRKVLCFVQFVINF